MCSNALNGKPFTLEYHWVLLDHIQAGCLLQAPWLLIIETDYVWMKPLQAPSAEDSSKPSLAFPFSYINPTYPGIQEVMRKMYPADRGPLSNVPPSGPAPVMMRLQEWIKVQFDLQCMLSAAAHIVSSSSSTGTTAVPLSRLLA